MEVLRYDVCYVGVVRASAAPASKKGFPDYERSHAILPGIGSAINRRRSALTEALLSLHLRTDSAAFLSHARMSGEIHEHFR
jgi:hypothetical protein